jgi:hypothetical protein
VATVGGQPRDRTQFITSGLASVPSGWAWYTDPFLHPVRYLARFTDPSRMAASMSPVPLVALVVAALVARVRPAAVRARDRARAPVGMLAFMLFTTASTLAEDQLGPFGPVMHALFALPGSTARASRFVLLVASAAPSCSASRWPSCSGACVGTRPPRSCSRRRSPSSWWTRAR